MAAGLSLDDVAIRVDTVPPRCARDRRILLQSIEAGFVPVRFSTAIALAAIPELALDLHRLAELVDADANLRVRWIAPSRPGAAA